MKRKKGERKRKRKRKRDEEEEAKTLLGQIMACPSHPSHPLP